MKPSERYFIDRVNDPTSTVDDLGLRILDGLINDGSMSMASLQYLLPIWKRWFIR